MIKKVIIYTLPLVGLIMLSGCATMFGGGNKQTISINSDKPMKGTLVYADGSGTQYFTTPATLLVDRKGQDITLSSDSNEFQPAIIKPSVNNWFWVNILGAPGGTVISSTTDATTGAMWKYDEAVSVHSK